MLFLPQVKHLERRGGWTQSKEHRVLGSGQRLVSSGHLDWVISTSSPWPSILGLACCKGNSQDVWSLAVQRKSQWLHTSVLWPKLGLSGFGASPRCPQSSLLQSCGASLSYTGWYSLTAVAEKKLDELSTASQTLLPASNICPRHTHFTGKVNPRVTLKHSVLWLREEHQLHDRTKSEFSTDVWGRVYARVYVLHRWVSSCSLRPMNYCSPPGSSVQRIL